MNIRIILGVICCVMFGLTTNVSAKLFSLSDSVVYDDVAGLYWWSHLGDFSGDEGVETKRQWVSERALSVVIDGEEKIIDTWEVAKRSDVNSLLTNVKVLSTLFGPSGSNWESWADGTYQADLYTGWFDDGQEIASLVGVSESFWEREGSIPEVTTFRETWTFLPGLADDFTYDGLWGSHWTYGGIFGNGEGVWVCSRIEPTTVNPVPEPSVMLLFGTGLAGLFGARLRKKKK